MFMSRLVRLVLGLAALAFVLTTQRAGAQSTPQFYGLGSFPGSPGSGSYAISADGCTIGGWARAPGGPQIAAGWELGPNGITPLELGDLPGGIVGGSVQGISDDGSVIVGPGESALGQEAFVWTPLTGSVGLGDLPGGLVGSYANGVSADGSVIAGYSYSDRGREAAIWTAEGIRGIGILPGGYSAGATAITPDGRVVVGSSASADGMRAFRWTEETGMVAISYDDIDLQGIAVSDDGRVVAGYANLPWGETFFIWTEEEGVIAGGELEGGLWESWIWDLNHDGSIAYGYGSDEDGLTALVWDRVHGIRKFQDVLVTDYGLVVPGWHLKGVEGISGDGRVMTGYASSPTLGFEGWALVLPPLCSDGLDNDLDGLADYPEDPDCASANSSPEHATVHASHHPIVACLRAPAPRSCGIGAELALVLLGLGWIGRRGVVAPASAST